MRLIDFKDNFPNEAVVKLNSNYYVKNRVLFVKNVKVNPIIGWLQRKCISVKIILAGLELL